MWCRTHNRAGLQFKSVVTDNPPRPGEVDHTTEVYVFAHWCWFFYVPQEQISESAMRRDLRFFRPYPRKFNRLQMSLQRQHFLLSYPKTLSVVPAGV